MLLSVSVAVPLLRNVTVWGVLVVNIGRGPILRLVGVSVTAGSGVTPVPAKVTTCGDPDTLSAMDNMAL
jgi:hypothetical protein